MHHLASHRTNEMDYYLYTYLVLRTMAAAAAVGGSGAFIPFL